MTDYSPIEAIAAVYMLGAHLCVRDDGDLGFITNVYVEDEIRESGVFDAITSQRDEVRAIVLDGIRLAIDGHLPTLDGLDRHHLREDA